MSENVTKKDFLRRLDLERLAGHETSRRGTIAREYSPDRSECSIVYFHIEATEIDAAIHDEISLAKAQRYTLEWKVYGHDTPTNVKERLFAAGFEPEPEESLMVLRVTEATLAAFDAPAYEIRRVHDVEGLDDLAEISREIGRTHVEEEKNSLKTILQDTPDQMSVYVAYVDGKAVACGRIHFKEHSEFAELAGGRTKTTHRNRGTYTALVATRLKEALARNRKYILVDALPTSEPILRKRGFQFVTLTQPFVYRPSTAST